MVSGSGMIVIHCLVSYVTGVIPVVSAEVRIHLVVETGVVVIVSGSG